jgi:hypothetical protein
MRVIVVRSGRRGNTGDDGGWSTDAGSVTLRAMKIKNVGGPKGAAPAKDKKRASAADGAAFSDAVRQTQGAGGAAPTAPAAGAGAVAGVDAILAAQDVGDATEEQARRQARDYGDRLLDQLEAIRDGLIAGFVPKERLAQIAQSMRARKLATDDAQLRALIDEIELRAEVEIAKLSRRTD